MKKIFYVALVLSVLVALPVIANDSGSSYDYRSGNHYNWNKDASGDTKVRGQNYNTGSTWNTNIDQQGNMRGTDSNGNMWRYDSSSKIYQNYGTGKTCIGTGAARTCF